MSGGADDAIIEYSKEILDLIKELGISYVSFEKIRVYINLTVEEKFKKWRHNRIKTEKRHAEELYKLAKCNKIEELKRRLLELITQTEEI